MNTDEPSANLTFLSILNNKRFVGEWSADTVPERFENTHGEITFEISEEHKLFETESSNTSIRFMMLDGFYKNEYIQVSSVVSTNSININKDESQLTLIDFSAKYIERSFFDQVDKVTS